MAKDHQKSKNKPVGKDKSKVAASGPAVKAQRKAAFSRMPAPESDKQPHEILETLSDSMNEEQKPTSATSAVLLDIPLPKSGKEWEESVKDKLKGLSSDDKKQLRKLFDFIGQFECAISKDSPERNYSIDNFGMRRSENDVFPFIHLIKKCSCAYGPMEGEHMGAKNASIASVAQDIIEKWDERRDNCILAMGDFEWEEA